MMNHISFIIILSDPVTVLLHVIACLYRQQQCLPKMRLFTVGVELLKWLFLLS